MSDWPLTDSFVSNLAPHYEKTLDKLVNLQNLFTHSENEDFSIRDEIHIEPNEGLGHSRYLSDNSYYYLLFLLII